MPIPAIFTSRHMHITQCHKNSVIINLLTYTYNLHSDSQLYYVYLATDCLSMEDSIPIGQ